MTSVEAGLQVRNLKKEFLLGGGWLGGNKSVLKAINDVSFDVPAGQSIGLVGESGCGKSTVARTLMGLTNADGGRVTLDGVDILNASHKVMRSVRRRMQMVFQDPFSSLNPRRTIRQTLREPMQVHRIHAPDMIDAAVENVICEVGLSREVLDRYPHEFSGGQRQRVGIARALALNPSLVIADEPVSALDVSVQAQVLNLLAGLRDKRNLSFLFISHDLGVVRNFCQQTCVMYLGSIVEVGPTATILDRPAHPYTALLRQSSPVPDPRARIRMVKMEGEVPSAANMPSGCPFHPRCPKAQKLCSEAPPVLSPMGDGRSAACHFPMNVS